MAKVQEAVSKVNASMGVEPQVGDLDVVSLSELKNIIRKFLANDGISKMMVSRHKTESPVPAQGL
jgi:hypothetical protein